MDIADRVIMKNNESQKKLVLIISAQTEFFNKYNNTIHFVVKTQF